MKETVLWTFTVLVVLGLCAKPYVAGDDDLEKGQSTFVVKTLPMHFFYRHKMYDPTTSVMHQFFH